MAKKRNININKLEMVVRNRCSFAGICISEFDESFKNKIALKTKDEILKEEFKEELSYLELESMFIATMRGEYVGEMFVKTYKVPYNQSSNMRSGLFSIRMTDKIMIYFFQNIQNQKLTYLLPWVYPRTIASIGKAENHTVEEVLYDLLHLNILQFRHKYILEQAYNSIYREPKQIKEHFYALSDFLGVAIESHIEFCELIDGMLKNNKTEYFADGWGVDDKKILYDLIHMSAIKFSLEYHSTWAF